MNNSDLKTEIDNELKGISMNEQMKNSIRGGVYHKAKRETFRMSHGIAAAFAIVLLTGTTVFAGQYIMSKIYVNEEELPALEAMEVKQINLPETQPDENGRINEDCNDYSEIQEYLGIDLLDSDLSEDKSYVLGHVSTDTKDYAIVTVDNYIIGDTTNYRFVSEEGRYTYEHGSEFYSPVSLSVDIVLSKEQLDYGWDTDYLGQYRFVVEYTSEQGYKVNIIEDMSEVKDSDDYISEKVAVFVADGIRYTLKGRTSLGEMKIILDSMK